MRFTKRDVIIALPLIYFGAASGAGDAAALPVDPAQKARIKAISNVFEVGKVEADYVYVEDLKDGRGFTVTNYGFCTNTREVSRVIQAYSATTPETTLTDFLSRLPPNAEGTDTQALKDFPRAWRTEANGSAPMAQACESVADQLYFKPALKAAAKFNLRRPIGLAIIYDTLLQHGDGDDDDSLRAIYRRTVEATAAAAPLPEADFLFAFLEVRRDVLLNPADEDTADGWRKSVTRVDALEAILAENPDLSGPIRVHSREIDLTIS